MKRFTPIVHLFGLLWLAGCASFSSDPKLVGTYSAENSEELVFMSDGRVFHVQTANGKVDRFFLGYYASSSNSPFQLGFAGPDTSPFIGTSFQFNADGSTVNASWGKFYEPKGAWQVTYRKVSKPN